MVTNNPIAKGVHTINICPKLNVISGLASNDATLQCFSHYSTEILIQKLIKPDEEKLNVYLVLKNCLVGSSYV